MTQLRADGNHFFFDQNEWPLFSEFLLRFELTRSSESAILISPDLDCTALYLLVEGSFQLSTHLNPQTPIFSFLGPQEMVGEMSFLEAKKPENYVVVQPASAWYQIPYERLTAEIADSAEFGIELYRLFASKLKTQLLDHNSFLLSNSLNPELPDALKKVLVVFSSLSLELLATIADHCIVRLLPAGSRLITHGETLSDLFFVLSGQLKILDEATKSSSALLGYSCRGEILGELSLLSESNMASASVVTLTDATIATLPLQDLGLILASDNSFALEWWKGIATLCSFRCRESLKLIRSESLGSSYETSFVIDSCIDLSKSSSRFRWFSDLLGYSQDV